jgi:hypothetical protein
MHALYDDQHPVSSCAFSLSASTASLRLRSQRQVTSLRPLLLVRRGSITPQVSPPSASALPKPPSPPSHLHASGKRQAPKAKSKSSSPLRKLGLAAALGAAAAIASVYGPVLVTRVIAVYGSISSLPLGLAMLAVGVVNFASITLCFPANMGLMITAGAVLGACCYHIETGSCTSRVFACARYSGRLGAGPAGRRAQAEEIARGGGEETRVVACAYHAA